MVGGSSLVDDSLYFGAEWARPRSQPEVAPSRPVGPDSIPAREASTLRLRLSAAPRLPDPGREELSFASSSRPGSSSLRAFGGEGRWLRPSRQSGIIHRPLGGQALYDKGVVNLNRTRSATPCATDDSALDGAEIFAKVNELYDGHL